MVITSTTNDKIKTLKKLENRKYRDAMGLFLVETPHLIEESYKKGILDSIIALENTVIDYDVDITYVSDNVLKHLSSLHTPLNMIGVCKIKESNIIGNKLLLLEDISNPGNLGTIIRSSVAFNIDTIILSSSSVDLYNPKVIRSSEGMLFNINIVRDNLLEVIPKLKENNYQIIGTNVKKGIDIKNIANYDKYAIIIGNEGKGLSAEINNLCDTFIYIKMNEACESLNAAVATSILLYELDRKK